MDDEDWQVDQQPDWLTSFTRRMNRYCPELWGQLWGQLLKAIPALLGKIYIPNAYSVVSLATTR